jgi:hypothetical protein
MGELVRFGGENGSGREELQYKHTMNKGVARLRSDKEPREDDSR